MTIRYVGIGGNDGNDGLSWANRKLTLNGVEDTPVEAGDTVYVGAGTYREQLTVDVSGSAGNPITYIGDYTGANTDGTGGVVRITGSDNDQSATRADVIIINDKDYRTFEGFTLDTATTECIMVAGGSDNLIIRNCYFGATAQEQIEYNPVPDGATFLIDGCYFAPNGSTSIMFYATGDVGASSGVISNCIIIANNGNWGVRLDNVGDLIFRNNLFTGYNGIRIQTAQAAEHPLIVNNNIFYGLGGYCLHAPSTGLIVEDYNTIYGGVARTNVDVGAHSVAYPALLDTRWFFEMVNGGSMLTPYDLSSASQLINVAGTSPTTADMRGTTVQGTQREWGALEYDSTLDIEAGTGGGGAVSIQPIIGRLG